MNSRKDCVCGDPAVIHRHHRPGSDCSRCPCREYRRARWWRKRAERRRVARLLEQIAANNRWATAIKRGTRHE
jgi:hypothetical protein